MTTHYRTQGLVFKKEDRLDSDRVFSVFTKDFGRVEVVGKAIRKISSKLKGGIEIFSLSDIEFIQGKNKKTLTDATAREKFRAMYQSPVKMQVAYAISETLDRFIKGQQEDESVFTFIEDVFKKLERCSSPAMLYYYFFWNFMSVLGYGVEVVKCVSCQENLNPDQLYFSYKEGGILCKTCSPNDRQSKKISPDVVKILRLILKKDWKTLSKVKVEKSIQTSLRQTTKDYYRFSGSTILAASHSSL